MKIRTLLTIALASLLTCGVASADKPRVVPDGAWMSLSGTVVAVTPDTFRLDYGTGTMMVEMDDYDAYSEAYKLMDGDEVTVYGRMDKDFFERAKIEAGSVYVKNLNTWFYANSADEEDPFMTPAVPAVVVGSSSLTGHVSSVQDEEFTLEIGHKAIRVEVEEMPYNPLDRYGYQKVQAGDKVLVTGRFDRDIFEGKEFEAEMITTLAKRK